MDAAGQMLGEISASPGPLDHGFARSIDLWSSFRLDQSHNEADVHETGY